MDSRGILLVLLCLITAVLALENGGSYECSPIPRVEGQTFTITFRIDRSKWPSMCTGGTNGLPDFQSSPDDTSYSSNCSVTTDIRTGCSFTPGNLGCGCTNSNDNGYYLAEYNFIAHPDYDRFWKPTIGCLEDLTFVPLLSFSGECDTSPPITTTTEQPTTDTSTPITTDVSTQNTTDVSTQNTTDVSTPNTTEPPSCLCYFCDCDCGCDKNWGCWLCIIICIVLALLSICLIIWCIYRFCRKKCEKCCPCCAGFFKCIDKFLECCMCCAFCRPGSKCCSDIPRDVPPTTDPEDNCGDESKPVPISLPTTANKPTSYASPNNADNPKKKKRSAPQSEMSPLKDIPSSPEQEERPLPTPRELLQPSAGQGQGDKTPSSVPSAELPPLRTQAPKTPQGLTSVERNSYVESRRLPLPSISPKKD